MRIMNLIPDLVDMKIQEKYEIDCSVKELLILICDSSRGTTVYVSSEDVEVDIQIK